MSIPSKSVNLTEYYYGFLRKLSKESRIDLIERLVRSLKEEEQECADDENLSVEAFFEAFAADITAEEILKEIRALKNMKVTRTGANDTGTF